MKKKILIGLALGAIAGILDVIPMVIMKLPLQADISAFSLWIACGFLISITSIQIHPVLKGLLIAFPVLLPCAVLIGYEDPMGLIPVIVFTSILGSALGWSFHKMTKNLPVDSLPK